MHPRRLAIWNAKRDSRDARMDLSESPLLLHCVLTYQWFCWKNSLVYTLDHWQPVETQSTSTRLELHTLYAYWMQWKHSYFDSSIFKAPSPFSPSKYPTLKRRIWSLYSLRLRHLSTIPCDETEKFLSAATAACRAARQSLLLTWWRLSIWMHRKPTSMSRADGYV